jgi:ribonuclease VapC
MAAPKVLDSFALIAFFEDEPGAEEVERQLLKAEEAGQRLLMTVVNLGEVWYSIARTDSEKTADEKIREIQGMAIEIVDADWALTRQAAAFKVKGKVAYADCFAAALAKQRKTEVITGDPEFKQLEGEVKIHWL